MIPTPDRELLLILGGIYAALLFVTGVALIMRWRARGRPPGGTAENLWARTLSFWIVTLIFSAALLSGELVAIALFALISLLALREFMSLAPVESSDHRAMAWTFFVVTPMQYALVAIHWYGFYTILIPVYAFLFFPTVNAMIGDPRRFLERTATLQWGLMVCVYCVSFAPAMLWLRIPGYEGQNAKLLLFCVTVVQLSDFLQYVFGKWLGKHPMAPSISPNKTWEGFFGGVLCATGVGTALWWATPFTPLAAGGMSLLIALMGVAGGLTMSAIKRDRGVKDFGGLLPGHGGVLDRFDSVAFSVPIFFHLTRFLYARGS